MKSPKAKSAGKPRFNADALEELAGRQSLARGKDYFARGAVQLLAVEPSRVLATVSGSENYSVKLTGRGKAIGGECSCPAFEDSGFCKHMVAAVLAANAAGGGTEAEDSGTLSRIRKHLKAKGIDALVEMIVELAERDQAFFRKLDMASAATGGDDKALELRLRKALDGATGISGFVDWRGAAEWANDVDEALEVIAGLASGTQASIALTLAERALDRIETAMNSIDNSSGHCGASLDRARDIHLAAARNCRPDPVLLAHDLFFREMNGGYDTFSRAARLYADVLGEEGLGEYRRLAAAAWDKLPQRTARPKEKYEYSGEYSQLTEILDFFAERDGDTDARIALRAKNLSSSWQYFQLAEFCLSQRRKEEALKWAEEGLWAFEDERPDERLLFFTSDLLAKARRKADAQAHLWRAFEKQPSLEIYLRLRKLGGDEVRERVVTFLEARAVKEKGSHWNSPADLLIRVLTQEKTFDAAWAAVQRHGASMGAKEALAKASEAAHPREALEIYAERVAQLANNGNNNAYEEAARLVTHMATLQDKAGHAAYVADLKTRFGRKRNFMKLLG